MIREYTKQDYEEVSNWFCKRNILISEDYLPKNGFIAPGIAAGFLYSTDSNFCIFECFISNPNTEREIRENALREIVSAMIEKSRLLGFKNAFGFATSQTMIRIGAEQGFNFVETCSTIIKDLR